MPGPCRIVRTLTAALLGGTAVLAAPLPAAAAEDLSVAFVIEGAARADGHALVDAGTLRAQGRSRPGGARRPEPAAGERRVGVRVTSRSGRLGFVRLRASLETPDPRTVVSVDGVVLTAAPHLVDPHAPIGTVVGHRVRVEAPPDEPPGAFAARIVWEVEE
jgi:hypothetical protein